MQIYWSSLIFRVLLKLLQKGRVQDSRSDDEDDEACDVDKSIHSDKVVEKCHSKTN